MAALGGQGPQDVDVLPGKPLVHKQQVHRNTLGQC